MSGEHHGPSRQMYFGIFLALLVLTALTVWVAFMDLGPFNTLVAMLIAILKGLLVLLFFMHVWYAPKLTKIFASAGFFWLLIAFVLTLSDYFTRYWGFVPKSWE